MSLFILPLTVFMSQLRNWIKFFHVIFCKTLANKFFTDKGVTQYRIISSLGATETYPFTGSSEIITDITSTGKTLKANNLRVLKDGFILKSYACVLVSKKVTNNLKKNNIIKLFSNN